MRVLRCQSGFIPITSGVPQGSDIGPILFILFVNDLPNCVPFARRLIYAVDVKLFSTVKCFDDIDLLEVDLLSVEGWSPSNAEGEPLKMLHYILIQK